MFIKENNLLKILEKKLFTVNKSYHESFKNLNEEELVGLCRYDFLLEKVHEEMLNNKTDNDIFSKNLSIYFKESGDFSEQLRSVYINLNDTEKQNSLVDVFLKKSMTTGQDLIPVLKKIQEKTDDNLWSQTKNCLYENNTNDFN